MKFLVFSDLHGNLDSLYKISEAIQIHKVDLIFFLGDLFSFHSATSYLKNETIITILNSLKSKIRAVKGNCDYDPELISNLGFSFRDYDEIILKDKKIVLTHGHAYSRYDFDLGFGDIFLSGHTHRLIFEKCFDGVYKINPGSASISRSVYPPTYLILDNNFASFYSLEHVLLERKEILSNTK